jgi:hypothetical protein
MSRTAAPKLAGIETAMDRASQMTLDIAND